MDQGKSLDKALGRLDSLASLEASKVILELRLVFGDETSILLMNQAQVPAQGDYLMRVDEAREAAAMLPTLMEVYEGEVDEDDNG